MHRVRKDLQGDSLLDWTISPMTIGEKCTILVIYKHIFRTLDCKAEVVTFYLGLQTADLRLVWRI